MKFRDIIDGLFFYKEVTSGWIVYVKDEIALIEAATRVKKAKVKTFDCFSPFPIHGLDQAMGLSRSWLTLTTFLGGLFGCFAAIGLMVYVDVFDWPMNIGGKPFFAWPAYIPIAFELTVLFSGFSTLFAFLWLARLGKVSRKLPANGITSNQFCVWIGDNLSEARVKKIFGSLSQKIEKVVL